MILIWRKDILGYESNSTGNKSKNWQVGLYETKNLLHGKGKIEWIDNSQNGRKYLQTIRPWRS
jgi:hypothetical protein